MINSVDAEKHFVKIQHLFMITLIPKPDRHYQKRKLQANIFDEYRCKNSQQILANKVQQHIKKDHTPCPSWIHLKVTRIVQYMQNQCDTPHQQKTKTT